MTTLAPSPGAAPISQMLRAHTRSELVTTLRNGEQLALTFVIPIVLLIGAAASTVVELGEGRRIDIVTPGVLALAVMSTAFTSLAIATGFERRYGVLKRLGSTPLSRPMLVTAKTASVVIVEVGQIAVLCIVALVLHWHPKGGALGAIEAAVFIIVGTAAFASLAMLLAGTVRAEATLAAANLIYVLLLLGGGVIIPVDKMPSAMQPLIEALPSGALAEGLRRILFDGGPMPWNLLAVLIAWTTVGVVATSRTFKWE
jgi:ABC-2 type transport system permease protein